MPVGNRVVNRKLNAEFVGTPSGAERSRTRQFRVGSRTVGLAARAPDSGSAFQVKARAGTLRLRGRQATDQRPRIARTMVAGTFTDSLMM